MNVDRSSGAPLATIVVLSYNRPALLEKALRTVVAQTCSTFDVLVVDNQSPSSDRVREVVSAFDGVRLIANEQNLGFTGGMNQGIADAAGEYVYLTEDDVELAPDCVEILVGYLREHPEVGMAGPTMWNRHTPTIRCAGGQFKLGTTYQMKVTGAGEPGLPDDSPFRTMFLPGAMIAARTSLLRQVGGFHSDFFMYREDVELCSKILERGLGIAIVPAARVYHHEPPDVPEPPVLAFHKHKNLAALYLLHAPLAVLPEYVMRYAVIDGFKRLFRNRETVPAWFKAWAWVAAAAPRLLAERIKRRAAHQS
jgi:GT2 family glycosyltransferase